METTELPIELYANQRIDELDICLKALSELLVRERSLISQRDLLQVVDELLDRRSLLEESIF